MDGLPPGEERLRRAKGVNFIIQAGVILELPQITLWVASVFFHRFYMRYSMFEEKGGLHHYVSLAADSLLDYTDMTSFTRTSQPHRYSSRTKPKRTVARQEIL